MTPEENSRLAENEASIRLLVGLHNVQLEQIAKLSELAVVLMKQIGTVQRQCLALIKLVSDGDVRRLVSTQHAQNEVWADQANAAIRDAAHTHNQMVAKLNSVLAECKPALLDSLKPIPFVNLPAEFSVQGGPGGPPAP